MHIQAISLEKLVVPPFLAQINLREVELAPGRLAAQQEPRTEGPGSRSYTSEAQQLEPDEHPSLLGLSNWSTP